MSGAEVERLIVALVGDVSGLARACADAENLTKRMAAGVGANATQAASAMISAFAGVSLAISEAMAMAARASVDAFADYEKSTAKIEGLVGIASDQVNELSKGMLKLAAAAGKSPKELAEGMFFVTSSGLRGKAAMDALTLSAKASAAGLGEVKSVAQAVVSAVIAYEKAGMTATEAADIFVATAREGHVDAAQIAPAMSKIMPIAAKLGVELSHLGGMMAFMTQSGTSASEASVQISAVMTALIKPTEDGAAALAEVGLSFSQLRRMAAGPGGLVEVIRKVDSAFGGNVESIGRVFRNVRALRAAMNQLGRDGKTIDHVMQSVRDSLGSTDAAFAATEKTLAFAFASAKAELSATAIELGEMLAPAVRDVMSMAKAALGWFRSWPAALKATVLITMAITAATVTLAMAVAGVAIAIAAAAAAMTFATGGLNLVLVGVIGGALALYGVIAAGVGAMLGLGVSVGYVSGLFGEMRDAAVAAWAWLAPVRRALKDLFLMIGTAAAQAFEALKKAAVDAWQWLTGNVNVDWGAIQEGLTDAVLAIEYALLNLTAVWNFMSISARYGLAVLEGEISHLPVILEAALAWLGKNWVKIWDGAFEYVVKEGPVAFSLLVDYATRAIDVLGENVGKLLGAVDWEAAWYAMEDAAYRTAIKTIAGLQRVWKKMPQLLAGTEDFVDVWGKPAKPPKIAAPDLTAPPKSDLEAFAQRAKEHAKKIGDSLTPFVMPKRQDFPLEERELQAEWEGQKDALLMGFAEFKAFRKQQWALEDALEEERKKSKMPSIGDDAPFKSSAKEAQKWDAVAIDSAEAAYRIWAYRERLMDQEKTSQAAQEMKAHQARRDHLQNELALSNQILASRKAIVAATGAALPVPLEEQRRPLVAPIVVRQIPQAILDLEKRLAERDAIQGAGRNAMRGTQAGGNYASGVQVAGAVQAEVRAVIFEQMAAEQRRRDPSKEEDGGQIGRAEPEGRGRTPAEPVHVNIPMREGPGERSLAAIERHLAALLEIERGRPNRPPVTLEAADLGEAF